MNFLFIDRTEPGKLIGGFIIAPLLRWDGGPYVKESYLLGVTDDQVVSIDRTGFQSMGYMFCAGFAQPTKLVERVIQKPDSIDLDPELRVMDDLQEINRDMYASNWCATGSHAGLKNFLLQRLEDVPENRETYFRDQVPLRQLMAFLDKFQRLAA